jgi:hypothetical protein
MRQLQFLRAEEQPITIRLEPEEDESGGIELLEAAFSVCPTGPLLVYALNPAWLILFSYSIGNLQEEDPLTKVSLSAPSLAYDATIGPKLTLSS